MENIVFIPALLMAACGIACVALVFTIKSESIDAPSLVKFFGLEIITGMNLTEKGKYYRAWYWRLFLSGFAFAAVTLLLMYLLVPEFQHEFISAAKNV